MKKKVIYAIIAAVSLTAGLYLSQSEKESELSGLLTENVEALASVEGGNAGLYQTMGYCTPSDLNYMCTSRQTAKPCRHKCPQDTYN